MKNPSIDMYVKLFDVLDMEAKLELLARLSDNIKHSFHKKPRDKQALLEGLAGAWEEVDDSLVEEIYAARTVSSREINLDD